MLAAIIDWMKAGGEKEAREAREKEAATTTIQRLFRGMQGRAVAAAEPEKEAREAREKEAATTTIQRLLRGMKGRAVAAELKKVDPSTKHFVNKVFGIIKKGIIGLDAAADRQSFIGRAFNELKVTVEYKLEETKKYVTGLVNGVSILEKESKESKESQEEKQGLIDLIEEYVNSKEGHEAKIKKRKEIARLPFELIEKVMGEIFNSQEFNIYIEISVIGRLLVRFDGKIPIDKDGRLNILKMFPEASFIQKSKLWAAQIGLNNGNSFIANKLQIDNKLQKILLGILPPVDKGQSTDDRTFRRLYQSVNAVAMLLQNEPQGGRTGYKALDGEVKILAEGSFFIQLAGLMQSYCPIYKAGDGGEVDYSGKSMQGFIWHILEGQKEGGESPIKTAINLLGLLKKLIEIPAETASATENSVIRHRLEYYLEDPDNINNRLTVLNQVLQGKEGAFDGLLKKFIEPAAGAVDGEPKEEAPIERNFVPLERENANKSPKERLFTLKLLAFGALAYLTMLGLSVLWAFDPAGLAAPFGVQLLPIFLATCICLGISLYFRLFREDEDGLGKFLFWLRVSLAILLLGAMITLSSTAGVAAMAIPSDLHVWIVLGIGLFVGLCFLPRIYHFRKPDISPIYKASGEIGALRNHQGDKGRPAQCGGERSLEESQKEPEAKGRGETGEYKI